MAPPRRPRKTRGAAFKYRTGQVLSTATVGLGTYRAATSRTTAGRAYGVALVSLGSATYPKRPPRKTGQRLSAKQINQRKRAARSPRRRRGRRR